MTSERQSRKDGHSRKFLTIIDETPECMRAVAFASRRAKNTHGQMILLYVIDNSDFQHFLGVGDIMRAEAEDLAKTTLNEISAHIFKTQGLKAEKIIREGQKADEIVKLINEDPDIAILVLGAGSSIEGPGPLVQSIAGRSNAFPIPVTIVPDNLTDESLDMLA